ncbi:MAG: aminotransferase class III-fold pyridoxal phosphate-dependent enzyme [Planctomycetaceae bacterium]|nr:aminotransferase class III-fold pyridoxal phosphate-dependent enzyme [Planctomycetaceae bacterium]
MAVTRGKFVPVKLSLAELLGKDYVQAVAAARSALTGEPAAPLRAAARRRIDFFPVAMQRALAARLADVGRRVSRPCASTAAGASTATFEAVTRTQASPASGWGYYRIGEDGRLYLLSKSEHYHTPLGHSFPGYELGRLAQTLGICQATHNNTRGHITRLLEGELLRAANGAARGGLSEVLNLQTGSLACEAGIKMMLARFYQSQDDSPPAPQRRVPVMIVIGDNEGGRGANYHGTTMFGQMLRGMWPGLERRLDRADVWKVVAVRANNMAELEAAFARYDRGRYKIAGMSLELVLMNYGGLRLTPAFARAAQRLCRRHDAPLMIDEIQTCLWSPRLYMYREYGLKPSLVVIGKGFSGGEYAASRLLIDRSLDRLPQFGALVTNGQEELASLAYLVTMRWAAANAEATAAVGDYYQSRLHELAARYPRLISTVEGSRHLASVYFHDLEIVKRFVATLAGGGLDISVQTYKAACPPGALTKLPLIVDAKVVDLVIARMDAALSSVARASRP